MSAVPGDELLDVLTINLWYSPRDAARRRADLAAYLRARAPDVVCCQETDVVTGGSGVEALAHLAGYRVVVSERTDRDGVEGEGLAVLTRLDAVARATVALPYEREDHPRALQRVDVATRGGTVVRVGNTHLSWHLHAVGARSEQADAVVAAFADWKGPAVVAGDLNDVPGSVTLRTLAEAGFVDAYAVAGGGERPTFDAANPYIWQPELVGRRVDHVLVRGLAVADAAIVLDGADGPVVSDHYGVRARLRVEPAEPG